MSTAAAEPKPEPDPLTDGTARLSLRASWELLLNEPAIRNYLFAGLGSLAMIFLYFFLIESADMAGFLLVVVGLSGLLLRWPGAPVLFLVLALYFSWTPLGIPMLAMEDPRTIQAGRFRFEDVILVFCVMAYLVSQYRLYGLVLHTIAFEGTARVKPTEKIGTRRPARLVGPTELGMMFAMTAAFVIVGQLIWWLATSIVVLPGQPFPIGFMAHRPLMSFEQSTGDAMSLGASRFYALFGMVFFGTLLARLVFGYWRLKLMNSAEAGMVLLDGSWSETKRERQRLEAWRRWKRNKSREKKTPDSAEGKT
jgi:hypothetical protein